MGEFLKKILGHIKNLWGKWSLFQRLLLIGIAVLLIAGIVALFGVSSKPSFVPVFSTPISDPDALDRIVRRLDEENVRSIVSSNGIVQVVDENTARRMRAILVREDLVPKGTDPWAIFDKERWTATDFTNDVNFRRAQTQMITNHIKALDDVDNANVTIVVPERVLFAPEQNPVSASVIITPKPGSDITTNRKKVEGIQKLLKYAVEGLKDENIVITDHNGNVLNDFSGMAALDRLNLIEREQKQIQQLETKYRADILRALQATFSADRIRDLNIKIDMDMSKKAVQTTEFLPTVIRPRTPGLAYDDSEIVRSITRSSSTSATEWKGTGFNPEGPAGVEGQTPPAFKDMSNLYGQMEQKTDTHNEEIGEKKTQEDRSPQIDRVTVSVNIDGKWKKKYDEKGKPVVTADNLIEREYSPVPEKEIRDATSLIQDAIGYNARRGDSVTVRNIPFERTKEFQEDDAAYFRKRQLQTTIIVFIAGLTILLLGFIIFRAITREMERRRRQAEKDRQMREQALRESEMMRAEQEGMEVSISVEERSRMELMESVTNLAKEHPEDCAKLIRTWLLEE
ncbi:MAG: flagellar M-ring protein FliF [Treponema sp.]|jgi:flagellar M-ring protein FliF|nr:flagellar M-ring protein FliF [Treponema sp.]